MVLHGHLGGGGQKKDYAEQHSAIASHLRDSVDPIEHDHKSYPRGFAPRTPDMLSRAPLRRRAPFAWLARALARWRGAVSRLQGMMPPLHRRRHDDDEANSTSKALAAVCALVLTGAGCATETGGATAAPQSAAPSDTGPRLRTVEANGIKFRIAEMGQGPLVVFVHGFPESWYSWRHQLPATAKAGFHAVAPDLRGYGKSDKPAGVDAYDIHHLTADVVGLIDALGQKRPRRRTRLGFARRLERCAPPPRSLYRARGDERAVRRPAAASPLETMKKTYGDNFYYILYFQEPGVAEAEFNKDPRGFLPPVPLARLAAGAAGVTDPKRGAGGWIRRLGAPKGLPSWLRRRTSTTTSASSRSGFRGGINFYRNFHRNWERPRSWQTGRSRCRRRSSPAIATA